MADGEIGVADGSSEIEAAGGLSEVGVTAGLSEVGVAATFKVMSYNIHCGVDIGGKLDLQAIGELIRGEAPDLVALQEVDRHFAERSGFADQGRWLAQKLGCSYVYAANVDMEPLGLGEPRRQYGTAILSRHPVVRSRHYLLDSFGNEQRGLLEVHVGVGRMEVAFYNVHLGLEPEELLHQADETLRLLDRRAAMRIVAGDFNAQPDTSAIKGWLEGGMKDAFADAADAETYPADKPEERIDYVFYDGDVVLESASVLDTQASDHRPIVAVFRLAEGDNESGGVNI